MNIPSILQAGDSLAWTDSLADYPASTYTLKYALRGYGLSKIDLTASASGSDHLTTVPASDSGGYAAGSYRWEAYVTATIDGVAFRHTVASGAVTIRAALSASLSSADPRSIAQVMLANIEDAILRLTKREVDQLTVNGKTITYKDLGKLLKDRATLRAEVAAEKAAERIAQGLDPGRRILTRFQ